MRRHPFQKGGSKASIWESRKRSGLRRRARDRGFEMPIFTKLIADLLPDEEYRKIQLALVLRPEAGKIIPSSGGLRRIRWKINGSGKRGGLRLIYFWDVPEETIYMLLVYKKSKQEDLTPNQLKTLRSLLKEYLR
jgi:mRNA-degrading endonuclease RelE of RelBE toxin-antitoxin system